MTKRISKGSVVTKRLSTDRFVSGLALVISLLALALSGIDIEETRRANRIGVRPFLSAAFNYDQRGIGWRLTNRGLGPGSMEWFEVLLDGLPVHTWRELATKMGVPTNLGMEFLIPRGTYTADADQPLFWVISQDATVRNIIVNNSGRVRMTYCFCSLQDECWIRRDTDTPSSVDDCESNSRRSIHLHQEPGGAAHNLAAPADQKASLPGR